MQEVIPSGMFLFVTTMRSTRPDTISSTVDRKRSSDPHTEWSINILLSRVTAPVLTEKYVLLQVNKHLYLVTFLIFMNTHNMIQYH